MKLISPIIAAIIMTFAGARLTAAPVQQVTPVADGQHQHFGYETQIAALSTEVYIERQVNRDQSTLNAAMWGTLDTMSISTQVATLIGTGAPLPTETPTRTPSPSEAQGQSSTPTSEVLQGTFTATPTFQAGTNTYTPTRTPVIGAATVTPTDLPPMVYAVNVGNIDRNVRSCPDLSCEVVAVVRVGETVVINLADQTRADNYDWVALWNSSFEAPAWISYARVDPPLRYLSWE